MVGLLGAVGCGSTASSLHDAGAGDVVVTFPDAAHPPDAKDSGHTTPEAAPPRDAAPDGEHGAISTTYPAFTPDMPQIVANEATVLVSPVFVAITWPASDTNVPTWEAMNDGIVTSTYWSATTGAYGVGTTTAGPHVHMTQSLPASLSYTDLDNFVQAQVAASLADAGSHADAGQAGHDGGAKDGGDDAAAPNPVWPAPVMAGGNAETVYSLFIPESVTVTDPGSGVSFCLEGGLGYHSNVTVGSTSVAYSVVLECSSQTLPELEETVAHEYVEATTNPYPNTMTLGYVGFDANHLSWDVYTGFNDELADACQNWADSYYQEGAPFPYWVQRSWSNTDAKAGHNPCVPREMGAYEGLTLFPAQQAVGTVDLTSVGYGKETTRTFSAKVGQTVTFQVGFYSDGATAPFTIAYDFPEMLPLFDATGNFPSNGAANVTIDLTTGQNGQKANVSVTPTTAGALGFQVMAITWQDPPDAEAASFLPHYLPVILTN
jgi:hypothetical protein